MVPHAERQQTDRARLGDAHPDAELQQRHRQDATAAAGEGKDDAHHQSQSECEHEQHGVVSSSGFLAAADRCSSNSKVTMAATIAAAKMSGFRIHVGQGVFVLLVCVSR